MNYIIFLTALILGVSSLPWDITQEEEWRRQNLEWNLMSPGIASISYKGPIFDNNKHHMDGTGYAIKSLPLGGIVPEVYGGRLDYSYKPSKSVLGLQADHIRGGGTDLKATGTWNFIQNKDAEVGISGQYERHLGGPGGSGKPDYGVLLNAKKKKIFDVVIRERQEPKDERFQPELCALVWYTDGSKIKEGVEAGVYGPKWRISIPLGKTPSIVQAEIHAIDLCASESVKKGLRGADIYILPDNTLDLQSADIASASINK